MTPTFSDRVLDSALADFPVIGPQLKNNVHSLQGSGLALLIGVGIALWAGTGVCLALEYAFDQIWEVPSKRRSNFVWKRLRALAWIAVLGVVSLLGRAPRGAQHLDCVVRHGRAAPRHRPLVRA